MEKIYDETNNVGTVMKYDKKSTSLSKDTLANNIGTCAALSALWLAKMHDGRVELSKPDQGRAAVLFSLNWIKHNGEARTFANIRGAGLKATGSDHTVTSISQLMAHIADNAGYWLVELSEGHFVAGCNRSDGFYLYDSNQALWKSSKAADFRSSGATKLTDFGWSASQEVWIYGVEKP